MIFVSILIVIVCLLLSLIVLVQNPKGGGLAAGFTGASQIGGVQRTADFLEKATWTLVIALVVLSLLTAGMTGASSNADPLDATYDELLDTQVDPSAIQQPAAIEDEAAGEGEEEAP